LKPDREEVNQQQEERAHAECEHSCRPHGSLLHHRWRDGGSLLFPELDDNEDSNQNTEEAEQKDDAPGIPFVLRPTPLQSQQKANNCWNEEKGAEEVKFLYASFPSKIGHCSSLGGLEEYQDNNHCDCTERQVDEETPTPCSYSLLVLSSQRVGKNHLTLVSKNTSEKGTGNRSNTVHFKVSNGSLRLFRTRNLLAPMNPVYIGRFARGTEYATMIRAPENRPAEPSPAIARPMINAIEFGAIPHIKLPSSKIPIAVR
jgi:hypothetical protein